MKQPSLLDLLDAPTANTTVPAATKAPCIAPFDFERDGDAESCVPRPEVEIPEEIRIWIDEPDFMPGRSG